MMAAARQMTGKELSQADLAKFQKQFQEALKNERLFAQASSRKSVASRNPAPPDAFKVNWVKIANFAEGARKAVQANPLLFAGLVGCSIFLGGLVAFGKRRPQRWAELRLER